MFYIFGKDNILPLNNIWGEKLQKHIVIFKSDSLDNIGRADIADKRVLHKFNKGVWLLLFVINSSSIYAWFVLLKNKRDVSSVDKWWR